MSENPWLAALTTLFLWWFSTGIILWRVRVADNGSAQDHLNSVIIGLPLLATRLNRDGVHSSCGLVKPYPGTIATAPVVYRSFLGIGAQGGACASIAMTAAGTGCGTSQMHLTGYGSTFNASDLSASYLGDLGQSAILGAPQSMGINVVPGQPLYLMANAVGTNPSAPCVASAAAFGLVRDRIFSDGVDL